MAQHCLHFHYPKGCDFVLLCNSGTHFLFCWLSYYSWNNELCL